jgi:pyruvyltransferase
MSVNIFTINTKNFGDGVNKRFWMELSKKKIAFNKIKNHYLTTGSIMCLATNKSIIFGTGFISENADLGGGNFKSNNNKLCYKPNNIISVRGPLTRNKLINFGLNCPENYGDPLILLPCIYNKQSIVNKNIVGIIPHYIDKKDNNLKLLIENLKLSGYDVIIIDIEISDKYELLIDNINKCKYIISSSLHGVIMGLIYKKKTIYLQFSNKVIGNGFKFNDFFYSLNIDYSHKQIYKNNILDNIININYENLVILGTKMIELIPFIDIDRKKELTNQYITFYNI